MNDPSFKHAIIAAGVTAVAATLFAVVGWSLFEFDQSLFIYAMALILSQTLTVYRFTIWAHRPPTLVLYQRAWTMLKTSPGRLSLLRQVGTRAFGYFALNRFVWKRGRNRWSAHWPVMIGCVVALAIVVPLIFGWVWFETPANDLHSYKVMNFGIHLATIPVDGIEAFLAFHGLVWASFPVIIGCTVALLRRSKDRGDQAVQTFGNDVMPLALLLAIAVTGLLMTVSYSFLGGVLHSPLAKIHMVIVCGTLLWLPYSKLFHIPQRTLKLASMIYQHESANDAKACCARCGDEFADQQHVDDLIKIQKQLGYRYEMDDVAHHYQMICPRCRRTSLVLAQGQRWAAVSENVNPVESNELTWERSALPALR
jgi:hypothetical protein